MSERDISHWLAKIPSSWQYMPLKRLADVVTGTADTIDADPDGQFDFVVRSSTLKKARTYTFDCEAVITAGDGAVGEVFHHLDGKFLAHQRTYVIHNFRGIEGRFFFYYFSAFFRYMCQDGSAKTTVDSVRRWMLTDMPIAVPPREVQRRIVEFLDAELEQIDALTAVQERLTALLSERRVALADVIMESIEADLVKLRFLFAPRNERANGDEEVLSVYRDYGVIPKNSRSDNHNVTPEDLSNYRRVTVGDLVVNKMKAWQGSVAISDFEGIVSGDYQVLRPITTRFSSQFAHHILRSSRMIREYRIRSKGIRPSQWRLYWEDLADIRVPVPDLPVQESIERRFVDIAEQDPVEESLESLRQLLEERRAALITAAVTGELEV